MDAPAAGVKGAAEGEAAGRREWREVDGVVKGAVSFSASCTLGLGLAAVKLLSKSPAASRALSSSSRGECRNWPRLDAAQTSCRIAWHDRCIDSASTAHTVPLQETASWHPRADDAAADLAEDLGDRNVAVAKGTDTVVCWEMPKPKMLKWKRNMGNGTNTQLDSAGHGTDLPGRRGPPPRP